MWFCDYNYKHSAQKCNDMKMKHSIKNLSLGALNWTLHRLIFIYFKTGLMMVWWTNIYAVDYMSINWRTVLKDFPSIKKAVTFLIIVDWCFIALTCA